MSDVTIPERPADIPQEVWLDTGMEFDKLYDAEPDLEGGCEWAIRQMAARMVLAERERCAKVAERDGSAHSATFGQQTAEWHSRVAAETRVADRIAQAIRSSHE